MGLFEEKFEAFGLDISDNSVKVFQFKGRPGNLKPQAYGEADLPAGVVEDGKILRGKTLTDTISNLLKNTKPRKIKTNNIICSLTESNVYIRIVDFPKMSARKIEEAIKWEAEQYVPLKLEEVNYDWEIVSEGKEKYKVLIAAAPKKILDTYLTAFKPLGLNVLAFDLESRALARALVSPKEKKGVLIVDLGARSTTFTVFNGGYIQYTASIPVAGNTFTDMVSKEMKVDLKEAEKLKRESGLDVKKRRGRIFNILQSAITEIIKEIQNTISFYEDQDPDVNKIDKVILCGGSANMPKLVNYFKDNLKQKVELGAPCETLAISMTKLHKRLLTKKKALSFASCIGLGLRGISTESITKEINLVTQEKQIAFEERTIRKNISFIANIIIIFGFLVVAAYLAMWGYFAYEQGRLDSIVQEEQLEFKNKDPKNLEEKAIDFNERVKLTKDAYESKVYVSRLYEEIENVKPEGVVFMEFKWDDRDNIININGKASVRNEILTFVENLNNSSYFEEIDIPLSTLEAKEDVPFDVKFKLTKEMIELLSEKP